MEQRMYSIKQVAEICGVTRKAVYDWMDMGKLEFVYVGARRRVTQGALDAFIATSTRDRRLVVPQKNGKPELASMLV